MGHFRKFLAVAGACLGLCSLAAGASAAAPPAPPAIGDTCLIGQWVNVQETAPGNWTWNNEVISVSGLAGMTITYTASGTETDDFAAAQPLIANYHGHQIKILLRGFVIAQAHADGHRVALTTRTVRVTVTYYDDGVPQAGGRVTSTATTNTYSCSAKRLHLESPAGNPGFGPEVDDLKRKPNGVVSPLLVPGSVVSTVGSTLATPKALLAAPLNLFAGALIALALVLFVTFPSHLFNRTFDENHDILREWWERRFPLLRRMRSRVARRSPRWQTDFLNFGLVVLCGGTLGALLDPRFGANLRTLAVFAGAVFAVTTGSLISALAAGFYRVARHRAGPWRLRALPSGLFVAAVCVLISRLTAFHPGYLYGLIGGVIFVRALNSRETGQVVAVSSIATLSVAIVAWLLWVPVSGASLTNPTNFGLALASDFLAAIFISGMVGLLIGLVPLRFLPGEKLATWHRGVWGAMFGLAALSVIEVMLRPQSTSARVASVPFWTAIGLFVGFGAASVLFWSYFRVRNRSAVDKTAIAAPSLTAVAADTRVAPSDPAPH